MARKLTEEAEYNRAEFNHHYSDYGCSCHLYPPCSWCTHPGNPLNQEDDECWEEEEWIPFLWNDED